jgi:signal transduction histidine kinase
VTDLNRSGLVVFRPRARLLKLIGAELISDDVLAVTELVKNAHDADALTVVVQFSGVTGPAGSIVVRDDGSGMDRETLLRQWMQPAGTSRSGPGARTTRSGRRVLGEKGVGRFAADKLGRYLELVSRRKGQRDEVRAVFDWDEFDSDERFLSEVKSRWELRPANAIHRHGTILRISDLRASWNERMFRRLATRLARLRSPFRDANAFTIRIESDEFPQYSGDLGADFLDRSPYRIEAQFDGQQTVDVILNGARSVQHLWNGHGDLRCGPVRIRIFGFDLETDAMARIGPRMEVRAWLREWSGISVYRDGFRVWPYGEPHDDWLRLDQRRVNNPVVRLSNNQVVGFVEITRDGNPELLDQTNREGLIHNRAHEDLRRLVHFVLQILEAGRQSVRHPTVRASSGGRKGSTEQDAVLDALEKLAAKLSGNMGSELRRIAMRARETSNRQKALHDRFLDGYSDLAALGQAAVGVSQSIQPQIEAIYGAVERLREHIRSTGGRASSAALRSLEESVAIIADRVAMIAPMETGAIQRRRVLDVPAELAVFRRLVKPVLDAAKVEMEIDTRAGLVLRIEMRPDTFHRLLHILVTNSLEWLQGTRDPRVRVSARADADRCEIIFSDNGSGIPPSVADRVFEPLFSGKEGGRGMGLAIARSIAELHGGEIAVLVDRRRRGANIRLLLPRRRSRATIHH